MPLDDYRHWTPQAQQRALEKLQASRNDDWRPFYCSNTPCDGKPHDRWEWSHARHDQRPPGGDWFVWAHIGGRGIGKTRGGSEYTHRIIRKHPRIIIVGATSADIRDVIIDGPAGIMATSPPGQRPHFEPSKRRLTWPNGANALLISAEEPERLRGPQAAWAWCDEVAVFPKIEEVWSNLLLGLRLGRNPRILVTTTPRPRKWLKTLVLDPRTIVTRASTYDNLHNLAPTFAREVVERYEGTRTGRQELYGEILTDTEGALWTWEVIEASREPEPPANFTRIVVGIDPAGSTRKGSDLTGIVVAGISEGHIYVLEDITGRYSPHRWATTAYEAYERWQADAIVVEVNFGADMVVNTMRSSGIVARIIPVVASRGKTVRAEPVVALFEQNRAHIAGRLELLEEEMATWVPEDGKSPNRIDAMVWACTSLSKGAGRANIAAPTHLTLVR